MIMQILSPFFFILALYVMNQILSSSSKEHLYDDRTEPSRHGHGLSCRVVSLTTRTTQNPLRSRSAWARFLGALWAATRVRTTPRVLRLTCQTSSVGLDSDLSVQIVAGRSPTLRGVPTARA
jgi:hypothetical protein